MAVYDTLIDDDEEIRELGASTIPPLLNAIRPGRNQIEDIVAPLSTQVICAYLVREHFASRHLAMEALIRLTGQQGNLTREWKSVKDILHAELGKEMTLFDEEKQNQYVDDVKEADTWSRVLKRISVDACPQDILDRFVNWTVKGLDDLLSATRAEVDGPLGWSSKADVYILGMRVLCAADVLLEWRTRTKRVKVRGSVLRWKLGALLREGQEMDLHGLWLEKIADVLGKSILKRVARVKMVLNTFPLSTK